MQKISSEVFRAGGPVRSRKVSVDTTSFTEVLWLSRIAHDLHATCAQSSMCMFFTLIMLYFEVCVQLFKRDDGNGEGIEGVRGTERSYGAHSEELDAVSD